MLAPDMNDPPELNLMYTPAQSEEEEKLVVGVPLGAQNFVDRSDVKALHVPGNQRSGSHACRSR